MKKEFENMTIEIIDTKSEDIITTSPTPVGDTLPGMEDENGFLKTNFD